MCYRDAAEELKTFFTSEEWAQRHERFERLDLEKLLQSPQELDTLDVPESELVSFLASKVSERRQYKEYM